MANEGQQSLDFDTTAVEERDEDERAGADGDGSLAGGPAAELSADPRGGAGEVLHGPGGAGPGGAGEPVDRAGRGRPAGRDRPAEAGAAEHGEVAGQGAGDAGDDPAARGPDDVRAGRTELGGRGGGEPAGRLAGRVDGPGGPGGAGAERPAGVDGLVQPPQPAAVEAPRFRPSSQEDLAQAGQRTRVRNNLAVLRLLRTLDEEQRPVTAEEQQVLARWSGWGAVPNVFDARKSEFTAERAELMELLSAEEY